MYRATEMHCDENAAIIAAIPAFVAAFNEFKSKIVAISETEQLKVVVIKGIATDKSTAKQALAETALDIANAVYAFAATNSNETLKQEMKFTLSKLAKTRDEEHVPQTQNIHDRGSELINDLKDYGITTAILTELQTAISNYSAVTPKPRTAVSNRKTITANLSRLFKEADAILHDKMDKLIGIFKKNNPDFAATYEATRIIIDSQTTTTQLKGIITDKINKTPVKGASITITELDKTIKSTPTGKYSFKPLANGKYTLRVAATGFKDLEIDEVEVKLGIINSLNIELEKL
jgi:hypothetical protein